MASITIKVATQVLTAKAGEINGNIDSIEKALNTIGDQISSSKNYWEGDASNIHQQRYKAMQGDIQKVIKELRDHPRNLMQMAGVYVSGENTVKAVANSLPADVII